MGTINLRFEYRGAPIETQIHPDQNYLGCIYSVN